jgi:AcrR family transcriptional regulator
MARTPAHKAPRNTDSYCWRQPPDLELTHILRHALDAFYEHGYHGTSVRDIARRVDMTVPALYYYHENKEAILYELLDASITRVTELCGAALADAGEDSTERFLNLVECLVLFMANSGKLAFVDVELRSLSPTKRRAYTTKRRGIERLLASSITDGVDAGLFDVTFPAETARALLGMIQAVATWFRPDGPLTANAVARHYLDIAAHAVGGSPAVIATARSRCRLDEATV